MTSNNFLQEAILRAASLREPRPQNNSSQPSSDTEDNVLTRVHSPLATPLNQSRATSPNRQSSNSRNRARAGLKAQRELAMREKRSSKDPVRRFPTDVSVRIFTIVGLGLDGCGGNLDGSTFSAVKDLLNCGLVCQKWRQSQVLNYVWYKLCKQMSYNDSIEKEFEPLSWTRKDSKTDWCRIYKKKNAVRPDQANQASYAELEEEDDGPTTKEIREKQWEKEAETKAMTKLEARAFYKELGGRKLRDKTGKGYGADKTGWEDREVFE